MKKKGQIIIF